MAEGKIITQGYSKHVAEVQQHWENAMLAENLDAVLIHAGNKLVSFLDDYEYPFRCNPQLLWWLPLMGQHDSALWIRPGHKPRLFYYQPDDYWHLAPEDPSSWWAGEFDIITVRDADAWQQVIAGNTAYIGDAATMLAAVDACHVNPSRLLNRIHLARTRKTDYEIACLTESARLGAIGHTAAEQAFREGLSEYDIHQRYCMSIQLTDAELPYGNIIALNEHGAVLHYQQQEQDPPEQFRSFLIDAGATVHGYASDITRTYAAGQGEFAELISAMDHMQQHLCNMVVAGLDYRELHLHTHHLIAGILCDFGIVNTSVGTAVDSGLTSVFYPHGLGHYLGLQTHDVAGLFADAEGTLIPRPEGHPFLRLTRTLEVGNVLTIEPGLYFIPTLLEKWRKTGSVDAVNWKKIDALLPFGGIRIEDNVLVRSEKPLNLSRQAFSSL